MTAPNVSIVGNITRQPELNFTPSGQPVVRFTIAANRRWPSKEQENQTIEAVSFFDCVAWGSTAENVAESLMKGARVVVTGRLDQRVWTDKEQKKRTSYEVVVDEVGPSLRWVTAQLTRVERSRPPTGGPAAEPADAHDQEVDVPPGADGRELVGVSAGATDDPF